MTEPPQRSDLVYTVLRQAIMEQALTPGSKLLEDGIGAHFGVSRTIVRAALQRLAGDGLVEMKVKRTATVAKPSIGEAKAIFEVRRCLEREVVRIVAARWKNEFGAILEDHVRQEDEAARRGDATLSVRLAGEFHVKLAELTDNPLLLRYIGEVVSRCSLILAVFGRPHSADCAINEHRGVLAALKAGNAAAAADAMEHHVGLIESRSLVGDVEPRGDIGSILGRFMPVAREDRTTQSS